MRVQEIAVRLAIMVFLSVSSTPAQEPDVAVPSSRAAVPSSSSNESKESPDAAEEQGPQEEAASVETEPSGSQEASVPQIVCGLDSFEGVAEGDARAAAAMICQELRRYGELTEIHDGKLPVAPEGYRLRAYRLGQRNLFELSYERPVGSSQKSVRVEFDSPEELVEKSAALVSALKEGTPLQETRPEPATESTSPVPTEPSVLMYAGIIGFATVGDVSASAGGADLGISVPVGNFSFTPHARLAFGEAQMGALGIDLRLYLSEKSNALFIGAGMSAMGLGVELEGGGGPAGSMLFGVEFNRKERSRVGFNLRADFPAFTFNPTGNYAVPLGANLYVTL